MHGGTGRDRACADAQGVVAFAPSFAYIAQLHQHWQASGLWDRLSARKATFVEPRMAAAVATCLQEYSQAALAAALGTGEGPTELQLVQAEGLLHVS